MAPKLITQPLTAGAPLSALELDGRLVAGSTRWQYQQRRDEVLFDIAWLRGQGEIRERLEGARLAALEQYREAFRARLDAACADYEARYARAVEVTA